jgi:hypothetical protein
VLFGASRALRAAIGSPVPGQDLVRLTKAVTATELTLGAARFSAAQAAGQAMSAERAVALARETSETGETGAASDETAEASMTCAARESS